MLALITYGVICASQHFADYLADSYSAGGNLIAERQDDLIEQHVCMPFADFKATIVVKGQKVHGQNGTFQVIGVRIHKDKRLVWTFRRLYPQESYGI